MPSRAHRGRRRNKNDEKDEKEAWAGLRQELQSSNVDGNQVIQFHGPKPPAVTEVLRNFEITRFH